MAYLETGFHQNLTADQYQDQIELPASMFVTQDDLPLDRVFLYFVPQNGRDGHLRIRDAWVELTAVRMDDGTALTIYDVAQGAPGDNEGQTLWRFGPGDHNATLLVALKDKTEPAMGSTVRLTWQFFPDLDRNPNTIASAHLAATANFYYRSC